MPACSSTPPHRRTCDAPGARRHRRRAGRGPNGLRAGRARADARAGGTGGHVRLALGAGGPLRGRSVVVTAGGTQEPLDPVRVLANRSSGKQGYALAQAALDRGAAVTLISGPTAWPTPLGARRDRRGDRLGHAAGDTGSGRQGRRADRWRRPWPTSARRQPSRQDQARQRRVDAQARAHGRHPGAPWPRQREKGGRPRVVVGFAAESRDLMANARAKRIAKGVSLIVANDITAPGAGFGVDTNRVTLIGADGAPAGAAADVQGGGSRGRPRPRRRVAEEGELRSKAMAGPRGELWLGTQGFAFDEWVGPFYPPGTPKVRLPGSLRAALRHGRDRFRLSTPRPRAPWWRGGAERTPSGFASRPSSRKSITHDRKLEGAQAEAGHSCARCRQFGDKLGVLTLQFAYDFTPETWRRAWMQFLGGCRRRALRRRSPQPRWLKPELGEMLSGSRRGAGAARPVSTCPR